MRERSVFPPALCRAARGLLGWSADRLALAAGLEAEAVELFEAGEGDLADRDKAAIGEALNRAGVIAIRARLAGDGVRFSRPVSGGEVGPPRPPADDAAEWDFAG